MIKSADISTDGLYRYTLSRIWDHSTTVLGVVMLNPSTADAELDDPTIRRCISFAQSHGYGGIQVANLFAYRATDPKTLKTAIDPVGPVNDIWLTRLLEYAAYWRSGVLCAWGANATMERIAQFRGLVDEVQNRLGVDVPLVHLGLTKAGAPRHPLYIAGATPFTLWKQS